MSLPDTQLLFNPFRLALIIVWFYLCLYIVQRYQPSPLLPAKYRPVCNLLLFLTGPLFLFVLIVVDIVRNAEKRGFSFAETLKMVLGRANTDGRRRGLVGTRGESSLILLNTSGKSFSEVYGAGGDNHSTLRVAEDIIRQAVQLYASDILIDPVSSTTYTVRFRVDGSLRNIDEVDAPVGIAVINSIKAISDMDIAEKRRPQDGAFIAKTLEGSISFRAASAGVLHGEKLSLRLLNQSSGPTKLKHIGLNIEHYNILSQIVHRQNGMILVCGPTGSGKSTTLYTMLREIDFSTRNVITIEDPIEYVLPQASQIEINPKADITFANTLRSVLRQDPDVISIGEIRDQETANIALQASQTGHLVLATLHSNSNISALVRLLDLGIKPLLLASALNVIISQRLMRKLCVHCKRSASLVDSQIINLKSRHIDPQLIMQAGGCKSCGGTGYLGRTAVFDVMILDDDIKGQIIDEKISIGDLNKHGDQQCKTIMQKQGMKLALNGETSLSEVKKIVSSFG